MWWSWKAKPPRKKKTLDELAAEYANWSYGDFCQYAPIQDLSDFIDSGGLEAAKALDEKLKREADNT